MFRHKRSNLWRDVEKEFWELFAHSRHRDAHRHGADCKADVLASRMVQLHEKFCAVFVNTLGKFMKSRDLIIMACTELRKRRRAVKVVYTSNFGDDKSRAALCTLFVESISCSVTQPSNRPKPISIGDITIRFLISQLPIFIGENSILYSIILPDARYAVNL